MLFRSLFGFSQVQKLPLNNFKWLTEAEVKSLDLMAKCDDGDTGYFVECDLHYPKHLHIKHANLPLAPEILEVHYENLSPYSKVAIAKTEGSKRYKDTKLMSTFHDKTNYVLHIRNLLLYISLGLVVTKIHRVLQFHQDYVLKPYIAMTTKARKHAESKFEMDLFKKLVSELNHNSNKLL